MVKGTNMLGKDNPCWPIGNALETIKAQAVGSPGSRSRGPGRGVPGRGGRPPDRTRPITAAFGAVAAFVTGWLTGILNRAGARLFALNDEEARWHGWQITELRWGLARAYRDARFDMLHLIREIDDGTHAPGACPLDGDC
jgi:hypothetical protein